MKLSSDGNLVIPTATASASNTTGALVVGGGVGVGGNINSNGQVILSYAGSAASNGGQIVLNSSSINRIDFPTGVAGLGDPNVTVRSPGTKIVLWPLVDGSGVDYAIGLTSGVLWNSVHDETRSFKWFANTTPVATLTGTGNYTVTNQLIGYHTGAIGANVANSGAFTTVTASSLMTIGAIQLWAANSTITGVTVTGTSAGATGPLNGTLGAAQPNTVVATSIITTSGGQLTGYHTGAIGANVANSGAFTTVTGTGTANFAGTVTAANLYATTIGNSATALSASSGTIAGTLTAATVYATTIGNAATAISGASSTLAGTLNAAAVQALNIGNSGASLTGTIQTASQTNITAVGSLGSTQISSLGVGTAASGTGGEIRATNNITAYYSDDRLKTRLGNIENALDKVEQLTGFYYEANKTAQDLGYDVKREVGVSAQEVQKVLPEIVVPAPIDDKYLTIYYDKLVPLLIEAIKELKAKVDRLEKGQ